MWLYVDEVNGVGCCCRCLVEGEMRKLDVDDSESRGLRSFNPDPVRLLIGEYGNFGAHKGSPQVLRRIRSFDERITTIVLELGISDRHHGAYKPTSNLQCYFPGY